MAHPESVRDDAAMLRGYNDFVERVRRFQAHRQLVQPRRILWIGPLKREEPKHSEATAPMIEKTVA